MKLVPNASADKSQNVTPEESDDHEDSRSHRIERTDDVNGLDHVRPENEVDQRLCPVRGYENHPDEMRYAY